MTKSIENSPPGAGQQSRGILSHVIARLGHNKALPQFLLLFEMTKLAKQGPQYKAIKTDVGGKVYFSYVDINQVIYQDGEEMASTALEWTLLPLL